MKKSTQIINWIESECIVSQGSLAGKPFKVLPWQKKLIRGLYDNKEVDTAAISMARGAGKTSFLAVLAAAYLGGPLRTMRGLVQISSPSIAQGDIMIEAMKYSCPQLLDDSLYRVIQSTAKSEISHRESGCKVRVLSSDVKRMHGQQPALCILDEVAQLQYPMETWAAISTSLGKIPDSKAILISTLPEEGKVKFFHGMLKNPSRRVHNQLYTVPADCDISDSKNWHKANPSLKYLPDLREKYKKDADEAMGDSLAEAKFRALRLNSGVSIETIGIPIKPKDWGRIEGEIDVNKWNEYALGLDMGANISGSACVAYDLDSAEMACFVAYPEEPELMKRDGQMGFSGALREMEEADELVVVPGRVPTPRAVLTEAIDRWGVPSVIVCDSWRFIEVVAAVEDMMLDAEVIKRPQNWEFAPMI